MAYEFKYKDKSENPGVLMKKTISIVLALLFILSAFSVLPVSSKSPIEVDPCSGKSVENGEIRLKNAVTKSELLSYFRDKSTLIVQDASGAAVSDLTAPVGSGAKVSRGDESVTVAVIGDVNRDAKINVRDVLAAMKNVVGADADIVRSAADLDKNGVIDGLDVVGMMKHLVGYEVDAFEDLPEAAENEDAALGLYFDEAMHQIELTDTTVYGTASGQMYLARREREDAQIVLTSAEQKDGLSLEIGELKNADGAVLATELRRGYYFEMVKWNVLNPLDLSNYTGGKYVDALPRYDGEFMIGEGESKAFYITAISEESSAPGWYEASVRVLDAEGREVKKATLRAYVWDFTLDEAPASTSAFGLSRGGITNKKCNAIGADGFKWLYSQPDLDEITTAWYKEYYDMLLDNHISCYGLPYKIGDERADAYMSDPRVTSFQMGSFSDGNGGEYKVSEDELRANYEKLKTNPVWLDKSYYYDVDEPCGGGYDMVRAQWNMLCAMFPDKKFDVVVPWASNEFISKAGTDSVEYCRGYLTIWCPQSYAWGIHHTSAERKEYGDSALYKPHEYKERWLDTEKFKATGERQWAERYAELRADGNKMWWYICCSPELPYANFFESYQGVNVRVVLWQQYMFDSDGILYWAVQEWNKVNKKRTNGDGTLIYWGEMFGQTEPVTSTRLTEIRDGIEDFQYMTQLERLADRETAMTFVNRVTTAILDWNEDYTNMRDVRNELGFFLEQRYIEG